MTKQAMVDLEDAGHELQLSVHDSLGLSIWREGQAEEVRQIMERAVPLTVPVVVDCKVGPSIGQSA